MIPIERILEEMERHLQAARSAGDPAAQRESIAAIRALSEAALGSRPRNKLPEVKPMPLTAPADPNGVSPAAPKREEDGANGDSIFDF
ncbi:MULTISPECIES: YwdI family protein [Bhargavaea]|uniref:YwdI family protein n=1 Tax=Bhargavaea changchunensis TaxID=2134037 RepID=A0ABW2NHY9_9BACL|nr:YwdI family protein [Bhargavaea sp. CC-171006]